MPPTAAQSLFLSTPSARRATAAASAWQTAAAYFYPRPPRGGRPRCGSPADWSHRFLSTPSARRATPRYLGRSKQSGFLSTPSARRATLAGLKEGVKVGQFLSTPSARRATKAYIHKLWQLRFLSTPSARRATVLNGHIGQNAQFLSTPSARRATVTDAASARVWVISIHALREEGDCSFSVCVIAEFLFLSTPSARRATEKPIRNQLFFHISIHALREEGDVNVILHFGHLIHFYPRPPRGGRRGA